MANELHTYATTGLTVYAVLLNSTGQVWTGAAFAALAGATWTDCDIAMTEAGTKGIYLATMPTSTAGVYSYYAYKQAGASPATTDTLLGTGWLEWSGTAEISLSTLNPESVWSYSTRTLTQSAESILNTIVGGVGKITMRRGDSQVVSITGLGDISDYSELWFTAKRHKAESDSDSQLMLSAGSGLMYVNGSSPIATSNGAITIDSAASGNITITLAAIEARNLDIYPSYFYDVQVKRTSGCVNTLTESFLEVEDDVTRAAS